MQRRTVKKKNGEGHRFNTIQYYGKHMPAITNYHTQQAQLTTLIFYSAISTMASLLFNLSLVSAILQHNSRYYTAFSFINLSSFSAEVICKINSHNACLYYT